MTTRQIGVDRSAHIGHASGVDSPRWPVFLLDAGDVVVIGGPASVDRELEPFQADEPVEFYDAARDDDFGWWLDAARRPGDDAP